jgi:ABC-2 type transport system permease protein
MSAFRLAIAQVVYTNKAFWRNPASAFFTFAFPLMFLVIFTALFGNSTLEVFGREVATSTFYVSAIAAFSIITATYTNLAMAVTFNRDAGVLKRFRGAPHPAWTYLFGRIVHALGMALLMVTIVASFGAIFYEAEVPSRTLPAFVFSVVLGAGAFAALGLAMTAAIPNADASPAIVQASILPLLFLSDIFIPIQDPSAWYVGVAKVFPVYHFAQAMKAAYFSATGSGFEWNSLAVLAIWGLAGAAVAVRFFSWEPRR